MITQTNTNGVDFLLNILQAVTQTNGSALNTNSVGTIPQLLVLDAQSALVQSGRVPGGQAYQKPANAAQIPPNALGNVVANTNAGVVMLGGFETRASKLGCTKAGAFWCSVNAAAISISLQALGTNTNGNAGDTTFSNWNQIVLLNPSGTGIDNTAAATVTVTSSNTNGANIGMTPVNVLGGATIGGNGGVYCAQNWNGNGQPVNATNLNITINSTGPVNFVGLICGS